MEDNQQSTDREAGIPAESVATPSVDSQADQQETPTIELESEAADPTAEDITEHEEPGEPSEEHYPQFQDITPEISPAAGPRSPISEPAPVRPDSEDQETLTEGEKISLPELFGSDSDEGDTDPTERGDQDTPTLTVAGDSSHETTETADTPHQTTAPFGNEEEEELHVSDRATVEMAPEAQDAPSTEQAIQPEIEVEQSAPVTSQPPPTLPQDSERPSTVVSGTVEESEIATLQELEPSASAAHEVNVTELQLSEERDPSSHDANITSVSEVAQIVEPVPAFVPATADEPTDTHPEMEVVPATKPESPLASTVKLLEGSRDILDVSELIRDDETEVPEQEEPAQDTTELETDVHASPSHTPFEVSRQSVERLQELVEDSVAKIATLQSDEGVSEYTSRDDAQTPPVHSLPPDVHSQGSTEIQSQLPRSEIANVAAVIGDLHGAPLRDEVLRLLETTASDMVKVLCKQYLTELETDLDDRSSQLRESADKIQELDSQVTTVSDELSSTQVQVDQLRQTAEEARKHVDDLQGELNTVRKDLQSAQDLSTTLEEECAQAELELAQERKHSLETQGRIRELTEALLRKQTARRGSDTPPQEPQRSAMETVLRKQVEESDGIIQELRSQLLEAECALADETDRATQAERDFFHCDTEKTAILFDLQTVSQANMALRNQLGVVTQARDNLTALVNTQQETIETEKAARIQATGEKDASIRELEKLQQEIEKLRREQPQSLPGSTATVINTSLLENNTKLQEQVDALKSELAQRESDIQTACRLHHDEVSELKKTITAKDDNIVMQASRIADLEQEVQEKEEQMDNLEQQKTAEVNRVSRRNATIEDLQRQLEEARDSLCEEQQRHRATKSTLAETDEECTKTKKDLDNSLHSLSEFSEYQRQVENFRVFIRGLAYVLHNAAGGRSSLFHNIAGLDVQAMFAGLIAAEFTNQDEVPQTDLPAGVRPLGVFAFPDEVIDRWMNENRMRTAEQLETHAAQTTDEAEQAQDVQGDDQQGADVSEVQAAPTITVPTQTGGRKRPMSPSDQQRQPSKTRVTEATDDPEQQERIPISSSTQVVTSAASDTTATSSALQPMDTAAAVQPSMDTNQLAASLWAACQASLLAPTSVSVPTVAAAPQTMTTQAQIHIDVSCTAAPTATTETVTTARPSRSKKYKGKPKSRDRSQIPVPKRSDKSAPTPTPRRQTTSEPSASAGSAAQEQRDPSLGSSTGISSAQPLLDTPADVPEGPISSHPIPFASTEPKEQPPHSQGRATRASVAQSAEDDTYDPTNDGCRLIFAGRRGTFDFYTVTTTMRPVKLSAELQALYHPFEEVQATLAAFERQWTENSASGGKHRCGFPGCSFQATSDHAFEKHILEKHNMRLKCPFCHRHSNRVSDLTKHMRDAADTNATRQGLAKIFDSRKPLPEPRYRK